MLKGLPGSMSDEVDALLMRQAGHHAHMRLIRLGHAHVLA